MSARREIGAGQDGWPGAAAVRKSAVDVIGCQPAELRYVELKHNDLAEAVGELFQARPSTLEPVMLSEVIDVVARFQRERSSAGLTSVLRRCGPAEAKLLVKLLAGDLRIGLDVARVKEAVELAQR